MYFEQFPPFIVIAFHACFKIRFFLYVSVSFILIELHVKIGEYPTDLQKFLSFLT